MKINIVNNVKNNNIKQNKRNSTKDLTSFGLNQKTLHSDIVSKSTTDTTKTDFLTNISFGGHKEKLNSRYYQQGTSGSYLYYFGENSCGNCHDTPYSAIRRKIQELPFAEIKHTNNNSSYVYFADPEEKVDYSKYEYIVIDKHPPIPQLEEVKELYLSENKQEMFLVKRCNDIQAYLERLLKTQTQTHKNILSEIEDEKEKMRPIEGGKSFYDFLHVENPWGYVSEDKKHYDEEFNTREKEKLRLEQEQDSLDKKLKNAKEKQKLSIELSNIFSLAKNMFALRNSLLDKQREILAPLYNQKLEELPEILKQEKASLQKTQQEHNIITDWYNLRKKELSNQESSELKNLHKKITYLKNKIENLQERIKKLTTLPSALEKNKKALETVYANLKTLFVDVEKFYNQNKETWQ